VSAAPEIVMREAKRARVRTLRHAACMVDPREEKLERVDAERQLAAARRGQRYWQWFAVAVLLASWVAEATMCAARGF
jgi:hypothetical protein